jgi:hypothetical protein
MQPLPTLANQRAMGAGHVRPPFQPAAINRPHSVVQTAAMNNRAANNRAANNQQVHGLEMWLQARPRSMTLAEARESALVHNKKIAVLSHVHLERSSDATEKSALFDPVESQYHRFTGCVDE